MNKYSKSYGRNEIENDGKRKGKVGNQMGRVLGWALILAKYGWMPGEMVEDGGHGENN